MMGRWWHVASRRPVGINGDAYAAAAGMKRS